jgi:hypothetical protein
MTPYLLFFSFSAWFAVSQRKLIFPKTIQSQQWQLAFVMMMLFVGLRDEVGADWGNYLGHIEKASSLDWWSAILDNDPAYGLLNWIGVRFGGMYFINMVCAVPFALGLASFCRAQPRPWLTLVIAIPYLVIAVAMGYTRQGVAIGLAMLGLVALEQGRLLRYFVWIACAALFHKSAVILIPLALFSGSKNRFIIFFGVCIVGTLLYVLLLQESVESLRQIYIEAEYNSSGAMIRIVMNVLPAAFYLWFRKRFDLPEAQRNFWSWMAWGAIVFVVLLVVSPSSTAVDRVALYWIPIQLFVWSRMPDALSSVGKTRALLVVAVVGYSAAVLLVWLFFSDNANAWLPYKFYPWEVFWQ